MVNGPGGSDGGPPRPIDGETGSEGADKAAGNASPPPHAATPRGSIDSRLGGLAASPGRTSSFRDRSGAELQAGLDSLVARVNRFPDLHPLLGSSDGSGPPPLIDSLTDSAKDYLLAGLVDRIQAMPEDEWPPAQMAISTAIDLSPGLANGKALLRLRQAQANELLPGPLRLAYEQSEGINERAARVCNLEEVKAVLAQEGVGGPPPLPDDTLGLIPRFIGGPQLALRERPKPLSTLAARISTEEFPVDERFEAFLLVLGAISAVQSGRHQVEPLAEMADAAGWLEGDLERTEGYESVLRAARRLGQARTISAGEYAHILMSLSQNFDCLRGDTRATREKLRGAIEELPEEHRATASSGLAD